MAAAVAGPAAGGAAAGSAAVAGIKWQREGKEWVPTSVDLYAINTQELRTRATMSVEQAVVTAGTQAQVHTLVHVTNAEPTNFLVDQMEKRIEAVVAKIDGPKKRVARFN